MGASELLFLLIFFVTNAIMTITGFAGTMLAMPASILLLGVEDARFILNVTAILTCVFIGIQQWKYSNKKELAKILAVMLIGMAFGTVLYRVIPLDFLLPAYGIVIIIVSLQRLLFPQAAHLPRWAYLPVLIAAGIIHGMFVSGGALLVMYATLVLLDKSEFRATIAATWAVLDPTFFVLNFDVALWNAENMMLIGACIPLLVLSVWVGNWLHKRINQEWFMKLTYVLLVASGLSIIL
ncbi:MAG: sulfite exporter TauE/SafE family protein [Peptococcaceae bacterium]|nr:sulfite exporter TauE/SafE family protein [Peptococcaceae bacterium]